MPELMFVLKSLVLAVIVTICLQVRVGSTTLESRAERWMRTSSVPLYLEEVSSGAVLAIRNVARTASGFVEKTFGQNISQTQKAGRFNFEFKRSPQYQQEHSEDQ